MCVLQHAVVKIVREKYLKTTAFESQEELQTFISELYVFLVDQMHVALNQVSAHNREPPRGSSAPSVNKCGWSALLCTGYYSPCGGEETCFPSFLEKVVLLL